MHQAEMEVSFGWSHFALTKTNQIEIASEINFWLFPLSKHIHVQMPH